MLELKRKFTVLMLMGFMLISLGGCGQKPQISNPSAIDSNVSRCEEKQDEKNSIPIVNEYVSSKQDAPFNSTTTTGKINDNLQKRIFAREIVELKDGDCIDFNGDNIGEIIHFKFEFTENSYWVKYNLSVGSRQIKSEDIRLTGKVYAAMLSGEWNGIQLLIDGDGPSADPFSKIFHYENTRLWEIGEVHCNVDGITVSSNGFSGYERGKTIQTWYRPADYIIASCVEKSEYDENYVPPGVVEVPREIYPMGTIAKLKCDLALQVSKTNPTTAVIIKKGLEVVLVATNDVEWLYVSPKYNCAEFNGGGWVHIKPNSFDTCLVGEKEISASEIFDGLYYAD